MDDLNDVINQTDRQLLKTKQNLAKKKSRGDERIHVNAERKEKKILIFFFFFF